MSLIVYISFGRAAAQEKLALMLQDALHRLDDVVAQTKKENILWAVSRMKETRERNKKEKE